MGGSMTDGRESTTLGGGGPLPPRIWRGRGRGRPRRRAAVRKEQSHRDGGGREGRRSNDGSSTGGSEAAATAAGGRRRTATARTRHRKGEKIGTTAALCCCDSIYKREWVWGLEMPPPRARRSSQGQRSDDDEGWHTDLNLELCYHITIRKKCYLCIEEEAFWAIYSTRRETPNPRLGTLTFIPLTSINRRGRRYLHSGLGAKIPHSDPRTG